MKKIDIREGNSKMIYGIVALASILLFVSLFGVKCLNPLNIDWLLKNPDLYNHYLKWDAFRHSDFTFPIMGSNTISYPDYSSYITRDNVLFLELIFKILSPILPVSFQYFGIWGLICFLLQGVFSVKLFSKLCEDNNKILSSSIIYVAFMSVMGRMYLGTAMSAQWMLTLMAILFMGYVKNAYTFKQVYCYTCIISVLAGLISPFYSIVFLCFLFGCVVWDGLNKSEVIAIKAFGISLVISYILLIFWGGTDELSNGITFKMPLLSYYAKSDDAYRVYIGLGELLLLLYLGYTLFEGKKIVNILKNRWRYIVSILAIIVLVGTIMVLKPSISRNIVRTPDSLSFYNTLLETIVAAAFVIVIPIAYAIVYVLKLYDKKKIALIFAIVLLLQFDNINAVYTSAHNNEYAVNVYNIVLEDTEFWKSIADDGELHELVFMYNASNDDLVRWALDNGMVISNGAYSSDNHFELYSELLDEPDRDTIFIFDAENKDVDYMSYDELHFYMADGYVIGCKNELENAESESITASQLCTRVFESDEIYVENGHSLFGKEYISRGGYTYGPYCSVNDYTYMVAIKGYNLTDNIDVQVYSKQGKHNYEYEVVEKTNKMLVLNVHVDEPADSFEIMIRNNSFKFVVVDNITLTPIEKEEEGVEE